MVWCSVLGTFWIKLLLELERQGLSDTNMTAGLRFPVVSLPGSVIGLSALSGQ